MLHLPPHCGARPGRASLSFARAERASLSFAFLLYLLPLWRVASPRSERSVGGPVIICLLFHLPTFMERSRAGQLVVCLSAQFAPAMTRGPSGPAYRCLSAQFASVMARGLSGPAYHCLAAPYRARPERASLSFAQPERAGLSFARSKRASLSFALVPDLRRSQLRVKSAPGAGGRLIILSRMVTTRRRLSAQDRQMHMRCEQS